MPELAELEAYLALAQEALDRPIAAVDAPDPYFLKRGLSLAGIRRTLLHQRFVTVSRHGKFLVFDAGTHELGLHFGMTGHLLVDGRDVVDFDSTIPQLSKDWDRLVLHFGDGGDLRVRDQRRLGGVFLDPDLSHLGPDVLNLHPQELAVAVSASRVPIKTRLLDQDRLAGVGNVMADEALWRAGIDPARPSGSLSEEEIRLLHRALLDSARSSIERGETAEGAFELQRHHGGHCPVDGQPLSHRRIRGRTTWFCSAHQH